MRGLLMMTVWPSIKPPEVVVLFVVVLLLFVVLLAAVLLSLVFVNSCAVIESVCWLAIVPVLVSVLFVSIVALRCAVITPELSIAPSVLMTNSGAVILPLSFTLRMPLLSSVNCCAANRTPLFLTPRPCSLPIKKILPAYMPPK